MITGAAVLTALKTELQRVSPRADGNYNAADFMWALEQAIEELERSEHDEQMGEDQ